MTLKNSILKGALVAVLGLCLCACAPRIRDYGYAPSDNQLEEIVVGVDSQDRVAELVGYPGSESLRGDDAWYYLAARQKTVGLKAPVTTDRQLVAISFDSEGTVTNIERFTLADGRVVTLSRRVTDAPTQGVGFLRQALSNLGQIDAGEMFGSP